MTRTLITLATAAVVLAACGQQADPAAVETAPAMAPAAADAPPPATSAGATAKTGSGAGVITAVDAAAGTVTINHGAIGEVGWPAMTMNFKASPAVVQQAGVGDHVQFDLTVQGNAAEVTAMRPQ